MSVQKKRNVGLIYEFLLRYASKALIEGDEKSSKDAIDVMKRFFSPGSAINKEFKLFNALSKTTVSSDVVAGSILREARIAAREHDARRLEHEKTSLIHEINRRFNQDQLFFEQPIAEYRIYTTIQTLLNDWRSSGEVDIARCALYEDKLVKWLLTEKTEVTQELQDVQTCGVNRLACKIMTKKLNEKYGGTFSQRQRELIKEFSFSNDPERKVIGEKLKTIKREILASIDVATSKTADEFMTKQLSEARERITNEDLKVVDDDCVSRFLLYVKLHEELESEEGSK